MLVHAASVEADGSEVGHCFQLLFFFFLSSTSFGPGGLRARCVRHACLRAPCVAWPLLSPTFALSLLGNYYFFTKKKLIFWCFFFFLRLALGHSRLGHPLSLEYWISILFLSIKFNINFEKFAIYLLFISQGAVKPRIIDNESEKIMEHQEK